MQQGQGIPTPSGSGGNKGAKFIVAPSQGIPTQTADAGNGKSNGKVAQFIVAPGQGIPTGGGNGNGNGSGNGNAQGGKVAQFIVAPGQGIPTQAGGGNNGKTENAFPTLVSASGGIPTPITLADAGGDPGQRAGSKAFPLIVATPTGITTGNPVSDAGAATADVGQGAVATDTGDAAAPAVAPAAPASPALAVATPNDLYTLLIGHGYGVEMLKRDQSGNLIFYVTIPGQPNEADLLLVDATYGKVLERKHIAGYGYNHPPAYAPTYAASYASDDNCEHAAGY